MSSVTLEELQGDYEISYQSTPQIENFYEPGHAVGQIKGKKLTGVDVLGVKWDAELEIQNSGEIKYSAILDPENAAPNAGLMNDAGQIVREKQFYNGIIKPLKNGESLILRTVVVQGPITINVQFHKK